MTLLKADLFHVEAALSALTRTPGQLREIEEETERRVLDGKVLVCGIHSEAHRRSAVVPLRWGSPRVVVMPGGFLTHLGKNLLEEPFQAARLWRYQWDSKADLAVSMRQPDCGKALSARGAQVDRLIRALTTRGARAEPRFDDPFGLGFSPQRNRREERR